MSPANANQIPTAPPVTPADRLGLTLCLAIIVHAVVVLGISFTGEDKASPPHEPMEIILVQKQSKTPDEADYLAQADLEGGGESETTERPATPMPAPFPKPIAKVTAPPPVKSVPPPPEQPTPEVKKLEPLPEAPQKIEQVAVETPEPAPEKQPEPQPQKPDKPAPSDKPEQEQPKPPEPESNTEQPQPDQPEAKRDTPSAAELMNSSMEAAALSAEIKRQLKAKAERPKRTFISASTKEYKYASYMEAWRSKVERVGNLNYPEEARKRGLTGSLILDVALRPDGSVDEITVRKSSGNKILDDAAIRIVNLAAPFAPFPDNIRSETDILHITRTWKFLHGQRFR